MTTPTNVEIQNWITLTETATDGLAVWKAWLKAWQVHPLLGHIPTDLFDAVLLDMEQHGLGAVINADTTRALRKAVTGEDKR